MTPLLLLPAALAALAALVLPLAIHIARRSEQRPTDFAALRWLSERPRPRARLRLDERLLLMLRLLLVALVALFLARPALTGLSGAQAYLAVIRGADPARSGLPVETQRDAHWLAPGFPRLRDGAPAANAGQPVASLLRELDAALPPGTALTLIVPAVLQGADGERPRLSRPVRWIVTPGAMAERPAPARPPLAAAIRHDPAHAGEARYLRAALGALAPAASGLDVAGTEAPLPRPPARALWLSAGTLPPAVVTFVRQGGTALVSADATWPGQDAPAVTLWSDPAGAALVEARAFGGGTVLRFTRALRPATLPALLEAEFPVRLRDLLQPPAPAPARVPAAAYAPLAGGAVTYAPPQTDLRPWLAALIASLLILERWLATSRVRGPSP